MRKRIANFLIIAGIMIFVLLAAAILLQDLCDWQNNVNGFARKYDSFFDMVFYREKGGFLISLVAGLLPAGIGIVLHWKDPYS